MFSKEQFIDYLIGIVANDRLRKVLTIYLQSELFWETRTEATRPGVNFEVRLQHPEAVQQLVQYKG